MPVCHYHCVYNLTNRRAVLFLRKKLLFLILIIPLQAQAQQFISKILFEGNDVTRESIMRLEIIVREGDPVDIAKIAKSAQNIMDLGLFEQVLYRLEEDESTGEVTVIFMPTERYYIIPLPTAKVNSDNELEYGVKLRWDNIWGLNHRLNWKVLDKGKELGISQFSNKIDYTMPRIFLSRYQLTLRSEVSTIVDEDPTFGNQLQRSQTFGFEVLRWLNRDNVSRGLFAAGGISYNNQDISSLEQAPSNGEAFDAIVYAVRFGLDDLHEFKYNREGKLLQYRLDFSTDDRPGNNSAFAKHELEYVRLHSFSHDPPRNINYKVVIGQSDNDVLGDKAFSLGGNTNLRGYRTGEFRGNAMLRVNFEYLSVIGRSSLLRKVFFVDAGDTPDRLSELKFSNIKASAGAGIRWKLRQFVDLDLRFDVAYAFESGDIRIAVGTRSTF